MADQCNYAVESENAEGQEASLFILLPRPVYVIHRDL